MKSQFFLITLFFAINFKASVDAATKEGKHLLGQLFGLATNTSYTQADVVATYLRQFAPKVTKMDGFIEYLGGIIDSQYPGDEGKTAFVTTFDKTRQGQAAQAAAQSFFEKQKLDKELANALFLSGKYYFDYVKKDSIPLAGRYLTVRYYTFQEQATFSPEQVLEYFKENFAPKLTKFTGFKEYAGILLDDRSFVAFANIFDTKAQAEFAISQAAAFVESSVLAQQVIRIGAETLAIMFEFDDTP